MARWSQDGEGDNPIKNEYSIPSVLPPLVYSYLPLPGNMQPVHGGASFGGLGSFSLGQNGGKFVTGTTLIRAHQFQCERKKEFCQKLTLDKLAGIHFLYCFYFSPFTRLLSPLQLPTGCCLLSSQWGRLGPVGEGVTDLLEQLAHLRCWLAKPGGERPSLSPPRYTDPPGGLA